ncbi:MAG: prepilin-type N-terminal cleavage/methylation domain-containing protein [Planctomycetota bacterium]
MKPKRLAARARGFTLIELLVVIAIVAILLLIAVQLGSSVVSSGKATRTEATLGVLDTMLTAYMNETGRKPRESMLDPRMGGGGERRYIPIADARNVLDMRPDVPPAVMNSVGLFLLQTREVESVNTAVQSLDPELVQIFDPDGAETGGSPDWDLQPELVTIFDGWGNPIRYVHPAFDGVQFGQLDVDDEATFELPRATASGDDVFDGKIQLRDEWSIDELRRNNRSTEITIKTEPFSLSADSDGGICRGDQPYFYSAGENGRVGFYKDVGEPEEAFREQDSDNVYTNEPQRPVIRN